MKFRKCLTEAETLERAIAGENLARFGDGEFNLAVGRNCVSQAANPKLQAELCQILLQAPKRCLPCLPDPYGGTPKTANWQKFERYNLTLGKQVFGSAFITRPDSAPWIDTTEYWSRIRTLWGGKDITLVLGSRRSLHSAMLEDAASVREIWGTYRDAYASPGGDRRDHPAALRSIDELIEAIGRPIGPVLLCLGPTATVMAARLAPLGVHAIDLGHLGLFMRHAGSYRFMPDDLLTPEYRALMEQSHREMEWGGSGHKHADAVVEFADEIGAEAILDYGCGQAFLAKVLAERTPPRRVTNYDPGIPGKNGLPKPSHLVVCSDVLEHVEPAKLGSVLEHIKCLSGIGAYLVIATRPANKTLPDGKNAHLIIESPQFWLDKINAAGWRHARVPMVKDGHSIAMWLLR